MSSNVASLIFLLAVQLASSPRNDLAETIARAEALYFQAEFTRALELLLPVDEVLQAGPGQSAERGRVKLQLALAYVGLNDNARAKVYLRELFALHPDHSLDPQEFSPKVLELAAEARVEQIDIECKTQLSDARTDLAAGNAQAVMQRLEGNQARCPGLSAIAPEASEILFKNGLEAYRRSELAAALDAFKSALKLDSEHELAAHYIELAQSKQELEADRVFLAWRRNFDVGAFGLAIMEYRRLVPIASEATLSQIHTEYRRTLSNLVDSWTRACARNDAAAVGRISTQAAEMLPDPSIGADLLAGMGACRSTSCIEMAAGQALVRLKSRVDPDVPLNARPNAGAPSVTVRVKTRISETGGVVLAEARGGSAIINDAVRAAVERWQFQPAILREGARCVDTEIPVVINFDPPAR